MTYKLGRTLGEGAFSVVKMATHRQEKSVWAAKIITEEALTPADKEALTNEVSILTRLSHKNIVKCREVFDTPRHMYIIMEFMSGGELFDRIIAKEHYNEKEAVTVTQQVIAAVQHCHENDIVHRDLKPENLLFLNPQDDSPLKLADFGLALALKEGEAGHAACGTPGYVAPEVLAVKTKGNKEGYGKPVDMWSVGVILYILLCGFPPFYHESNSKLFELIQKADYSFPSPYWDEVSETAKDLIRKLLVLNPKERLTAEQALQHPFLVEENTNQSKFIHFKEQMTAFNARTRMRKAIRAVQFMNKMIKSAANSRSNSRTNSRSGSLKGSILGGAAATNAAATAAATATVAGAADALNKAAEGDSAATAGATAEPSASRSLVAGSMVAGTAAAPAAAAPAAAAVDGAPPAAAFATPK
jgi:calcium/calmodulin-dependent protein kinase I